MAHAGGRVEAYYARGMLEIRPTLHLAVRTAVRLNQVLQQSGAAAEGAGFWQWAWPAFVLLDVAIWVVLRRSDRFGLSWRLPLDSFDAAFWAASPLPANGGYDWAVLIAVPLAMEAGVRLGWRGLAVPAAVLVSTSAAAAATGKPTALMGPGWIVLSVAMGAAFFRYCRRLDEKAEHERRRLLGATRRRAYLAGQNDVAMGASSAVDAMEGLVPVLGRPRVGSAFWRLADGWKSQLSASTSEEATYLQVALLEWERIHNRHPDLTGLVRIHVDEGQGTTLLTADQVTELRRSLDRLDLRGTVAVRLRDPDAARLPGQSLRLDLEGHAIVLRADRRAEPPPFDPCGVVYSYLFVLSVAGGISQLGGLAPLAVVAAAGTCVAVGSVSHRWTAARGERARRGVFLLAVATATWLTLLSAFMRHPVTVDGEPIFGFGMSLLLLSFLGGFYWRSLAGLRWLAPAAMGVNIALGLLLFPVPGVVSGRAVLAAVAYNLLPFFPCLHLRRALDRAAGRHAASVETVDEGVEQAAFLEGRDSVVGMVREAREDALRQLALVGPRIDAQIAEVAADRLQEVDRRLREMERERVSSHSTTTS